VVEVEAGKRPPRDHGEPLRITAQQVTTNEFAVFQKLAVPKTADPCSAKFFVTLTGGFDCAPVASFLQLFSLISNSQGSINTAPSTLIEPDSLPERFTKTLDYLPTMPGRRSIMDTTEGEGPRERGLGSRRGGGRMCLVMPQENH